MDKAPAAEIPVALVGCGAISRFFYVPTLKALARPETLRVAALVDPSTQNLNRVAEDFSNAPRFATIEDAGIGPDHLVIIASPPRFHAPQCIFALAKGAAVLCEKPMAASVHDAEQMIATAGDGAGLLAVGMYRRFFPAAEAIRRLIEMETLGVLRSFKIQEGGPFGWQAASESFFRRDATPGGVLYDTGVHTLDLLLWWLGEPSEILYEDDAMGGLEANCRVTLSYPNDCTGEVRLSRDWKTENCYVFCFEHGCVRWTVNDANHLEILVDGLAVSVRGELIQVSQRGARIIEQGPANSNAQSFIEQVRTVAAAKRGLERLKVPGSEGIRALRLIDRCYRNRRAMRIPWLTRNEEVEAQRLAAGSGLMASAV
jgi:predicted dehydrogenase